MNVPFVLLCILLALMTFVGGKRGVKSFFTIFLNFIILFVMLLLIGAGIEPVKLTVIVCIIITCITLFFINGVNLKTVSALLSVTIVVFFTMLITYKLGIKANIQGFGSEQGETLSALSVYVQLNFGKVVICQILVGLLGAVIDVSISVASAMYEIYKDNPQASKQSIFSSGMNIGKDILGTMTNTLLFAYIGGFMTLLIYLSELHYSIDEVLNAKIFCSDVFQSLCGGVGIVFIIPVTAFITAELLFLRFPLLFSCNIQNSSIKLKKVNENNKK